MSKVYLVIGVLSALVFCSSCYNRLTGVYDEFPVLSESFSKSAIVGRTGLTPEQIKVREEQLLAESSKPLPVYRINAGDKIGICVYNHPDLNTNTIVTPDGHIGMLFARQLKVAGLTMAEAGELIESVLSEYIVAPRVGVTPVEINSETLTLAGGVSNPGVYPVSNGMRLADLYAMAGGSAARYFDGQVLEVADLVNSRFIRDGKLLPVDFRKAIEDGDMLNNILLRKGDYVYIAVRTESLVCLIGDVANPHKRMWDNNLGLLELLTTGGWVHETYWPYVIIIRGGVANPTLYKVDLDGILQGRCPNIYLDPGDVVYVPHDNISEYNVFIRKVLPTGSLVNLLLSPRGWFK